MEELKALTIAIKQLLGEGGRLAEVMPGFSPRPGQLEMALSVARALVEGRAAVVEAATGTGKSLAYLVPAVVSGQKVVISTATRALQDQLSQRQMPLVEQALGRSVGWSVLKGRTNYLCLRRYYGLLKQLPLGMEGMGGVLGGLRAWLEETTTGDLDEIRGELLSPGLEAELTSDSEQCLGGKCPYRAECFLTEARRQAALSEIVFTNHHLLLADLVLRAQGFGEALPRYQAVIFDEAHQVPEIATAAFSTAITSRRVQRLITDAARELVGVVQELNQLLGPCQQQAEGFFGHIRELAGTGGRKGLGRKELGVLAPAASALAQALEELAKVAWAKASDEAHEAIASRAEGIAGELYQLEGLESGGELVVWAEAGGTSVGVHVAPVDPGPILAQELYGSSPSVVFTSATLAPGGELGAFARRVGLHESEVITLRIPSPFDLASQCLLYVPEHMPLPGDRRFPEAVADEVKRIVSITGGRAFVLFTTHRNMQLVSRLLIPQLPYTCLVQGQAPKMQLLKRFVDEAPAVLFATASFWQGVDVPGPALSAVIVDKLPFAPPDDPLVAARVQLVEASGGSGFNEVMLPEAVMALTQGLGRLVRTPTDRGVLAVLDTRILTKGYGKRFLRALKPVPLTRSLEELKRFFSKLKSQGRKEAHNQPTPNQPDHDTCSHHRQRHPHHDP